MRNSDVIGKNRGQVSFEDWLGAVKETIKQEKIGMGNDVSFLIMLCDVNAEHIIKCAIKLDRDLLEGGCDRYYMEPECWAALHNLLPKHLQGYGKIIHVEEITSVHIVKDCQP